MIARNENSTTRSKNSIDVLNGETYDNYMDSEEINNITVINKTSSSQINPINNSTGSYIFDINNDVAQKFQQNTAKMSFTQAVKTQTSTPKFMNTHNLNNKAKVNQNNNIDGYKAQSNEYNVSLDKNRINQHFRQSKPEDTQKSKILMFVKNKATVITGNMIHEKVKGVSKIKTFSLFLSRIDQNVLKEDIEEMIKTSIGLTVIKLEKLVAFQQRFQSFKLVIPKEQTKQAYESQN